MLLIIQPNDIHNKHSATDNTVAYFFDKKSLTTRFGQNGEVDFGKCGCAPCSIQPSVHRQADDDRRTALAGVGRAQNRAVLLHPGLGQVAELSGRYDLYPTYPDAVSTSRPHTQRTLACAGALPYGRVRQHFLAKRHLFVGIGHDAFPRYFLLHHRAKHGAAKGYVQG